MHNTALQLQAWSSASETLPLLDLGQITSVFWASVSFGVLRGNVIIAQGVGENRMTQGTCSGSARAASGSLTTHSCSLLLRFCTCTSVHKDVWKHAAEMLTTAYVQGTDIPCSFAFYFLLLFCIAEFLQWTGVIFIKSHTILYIPPQHTDSAQYEHSLF